MNKKLNFFRLTIGIIIGVLLGLALISIASIVSAGSPDPAWIEPEPTPPLSRQPHFCQDLEASRTLQREYPSQWLVCQKRGGGKSKEPRDPCVIDYTAILPETDCYEIFITPRD